MLSIDEAIAKYKEITNVDANCPAHCNISCDKCVQESRQLVEWLEELKALREKNETLKALYEDARKEGNSLLKHERNKAIDDAMVASAKSICVGCGYLDGIKCKYKGGNCGVSKPMLEVVVKALELLKAGVEG